MNVSPQIQPLLDGRSIALVHQPTWIIQEVWENLPRGMLDERPSLWVVEPYSHSFLDMRGHETIEEMLRNPNVHFFVGDDFHKKIVHYLVHANGVDVPHHIISPDYIDIQPAMQEGEVARNKKAAELTTENRKWYAEHKNGLRGFFKPMLFTTRFSSVVRYVMDGLLWGFEMNQNEAALLMEENVSDRVGAFDIAEAIDRFHPTHIMAINWVRPTNTLIPPEIKWWSWIQDRGSQAFTTKNIGPNDRVFAYSLQFKKELEANGWTDVHVLPPGVNTHVYGPGSTEERFKCEIGIFTDVLHPSSVEGDEKMKAFFKQRILQRAVPASKMHRARMNFRLYGRGWDHWIKFTPRYMGVCPPGDVFARALRGCKIMLQQNKDTNVHTRLWSGILCGAFPVVQSLGNIDYEPGGLNDLLGGNARKWIGFYDGRKDLIPTLRGFIKHEEGRRKAVADAAEYVAKHHNYAVRAEWLRRLAWNEER